MSTGGATGTGGAVTTGGTSAATGGNTGGTSATGGSRGTGGTSGPAGTGGATSSGGTTSTAGTTGTGGGSGGTSGTGGSTISAPDAGVDDRDATGADRTPDALAPDTRDTGADAPGADTTSTTTTVTVYVVGDSTVSTYTNSSIHQAGWGQFLQDYFITNAKVVNKAVGGMTARHFIEAGYLDSIIAVLKTGDYLLVQFGTNDGNTTATYTLPGSTTAIPYYLDPQTDFKTYLTKYVDATNAKSATTIFVTPPPRHSCNAGETGVRNGLAAYATAMKELGPTLNTPVVDLNAMTIAYLANVTCETSGSSFYLVKADGTIDSTHFQETGANIMAGLVAKGTTGVSTLGILLSAYVK
jgi:lysophospholipase L1-like esterase